MSRWTMLAVRWICSPRPAPKASGLTSCWGVTRMAVVWMRRSLVAMRGMGQALAGAAGVGLR